jgi:hypothetical protein
MENLKTGLSIPMYGLHYIDSVDNVIYKDEDVALFRRDYSLDDRQRMFQSLEWAMNNPNTNFNNIKPYESTRFSNEEIFEYLKKIFSFMKDHKLNIR